LARAKRLERSSDDFPESFDGMFGFLAEDRLKFGEDLLDRIEIGAVGREVREYCAAGLDCVADARLLNAGCRFGGTVAAKSLARVSMLRRPQGCGSCPTSGRRSGGLELPSRAQERKAARCYPASMEADQANAITTVVAQWATERDDIRAMALSGSWARGNPGPTSDLDLLLLTDLAQDYRNGTWPAEIVFQNAGFQLQSTDSAIYGVVWSAHLHLMPVADVELTFAKCAWASVDPVDNGTRVVVKDAFQIIFDRDGILAKLVNALMTG
jgi:hypothetical protein